MIENFLLHCVKLYSYIDGPLFVALVLLSRRGVDAVLPNPEEAPTNGATISRTCSISWLFRLSNKLTVLFVNAKPIQAVARPLLALSSGEGFD